MSTHSNIFTLPDWRRTVATMYQAVRNTPTSEQPYAWQRFCASRNELFKLHPQTPLLPEQRRTFSGLDYYPYNPSWRLIGRLDEKVERETFTVELRDDDIFRYTRVGRAHFTVEGLLSSEAALSVFSIEGYGGGIFLPFLDATSGQSSYGGGRYLYDTIKGADLGIGSTEIVLDFNYAYNPSCAYNHLWVCPLSPRENRLPFAVEAGEKIFV